jgi:hypothetical protein
MRKIFILFLFITQLTYSQECFIFQDGIPIMSFSTNKNGTFSPVISPNGTGIFKFGDGTVYVSSNAPTHTYSSSATKTVTIFKGSINLSNAIGIALNSQNILGFLDISKVPIGGAVQFRLNSGLTTILNPTSSFTITSYWVNSCNLTDTLDLSHLTGLGGDLEVYSNSNLKYIKNPTSSQVFSVYWANSCNLTGTLDLSHLTGLGGDVEVYTNSNLTKIKNPTSSTTFTAYSAYSCNLTDTLDLSGLTGFGGAVTLRFNSNLKYVKNPTSSTVFNWYLINSCNLTGTFDFSGFSNFAGSFDIFSNSNLTAISNPTSSRNINHYYAYSCNVKKFDLSTLTGINGDLRVYSNANDTALVFPTLTGQFTTIDAHNNALNQNSVDQLFIKLDAWYTAHAPTANLSINVGGGTNASPTGGSANVNIVHLNAIFNAVPKLLSITKN